MDEALAHKLFGDWSEDHWHLAVFINADFAPDDEAEAWVEELLAGALAAMANAGLAVTRTPLRTDDARRAAGRAAGTGAHRRRHVRAWRERQRFGRRPPP